MMAERLSQQCQREADGMKSTRTHIHTHTNNIHTRNRNDDTRLNCLKHEIHFMIKRRRIPRVMAGPGRCRYKSVVGLLFSFFVFCFYLLFLAFSVSRSSRQRVLPILDMIYNSNGFWCVFLFHFSLPFFIFRAQRFVDAFVKPFKTVFHSVDPIW